MNRRQVRKRTGAGGRKKVRGTQRPPLDPKQVFGVQLLICGLLLLAVLTLQRTPAAATAYDAVETALTRNYTLQDIQTGVKTAWNRVRTGGTQLLAAIGDLGELRIHAPSDGEPILAASANADGTQRGKMLVYTAEEGELQVYAAAGGTVTETLDLGDGTFLIRISHGDEAYTDYQGTGTVYTRPLDKVKKGQLIAAVSGDLFFALTMDGTSVDPLEYMK